MQGRIQDFQREGHALTSTSLLYNLRIAMKVHINKIATLSEIDSGAF